MKREDIENKALALLDRVIAGTDYEPVDIEFVREAGNDYLRIYIDKPGGVTIDDCEIVSRAMSDLLDEEDFIEDAYILEVSSPGLGRPLKKDRDFERAMGGSVEIRLFAPKDGKKQYMGTLTAWDEKSITICDADTTMTFDRKTVALIRTAIEFESGHKE